MNIKKFLSLSLAGVMLFTSMPVGYATPLSATTETKLQLIYDQLSSTDKTKLGQVRTKLSQLGADYGSLTNVSVKNAIDDLAASYDTDSNSLNGNGYVSVSGSTLKNDIYSLLKGLSNITYSDDMSTVQSYIDNNQNAANRIFEPDYDLTDFTNLYVGAINNLSNVNLSLDVDSKVESLGAALLLALNSSSYGFSGALTDIGWEPTEIKTALRTFGSYADPDPHYGTVALIDATIKANNKQYVPPTNGGGGGGGAVTPTPEPTPTPTPVVTPPTTEQILDIISSAGSVQTEAQAIAVITNVQAATTKLIDAAATAQTATEIAKLATDINSMMSSMTSLAGRITTSEGALSALTANKTITAGLDTVVQKMTTQADINSILNNTNKMLASSADLIKLTQNPTEALSVTKAIIADVSSLKSATNSSTVMSTATSAKAAAQLQAKAVEVAKAYVEAAATQNVPVVVKNNVSVATVSAEQIGNMIQNSTAAVAEMKITLATNNININKAVQPVIKVNVQSAVGAQDVKVMLPALPETAVAVGIMLKSPIAEISLPKEVVAELKSKPLEINVSNVAKSELPAVVAAKIPGSARTFDFSALSGGSTVSTFARNLEIFVPMTFNPNLVPISRYVDIQGNVSNIPGHATENGFVFATSHFSTYYVEEVKPIQFADTKDSYANEYIKVLQAHGIVTGSEGKFMPTDSITRAEFAAMVSRMLNLKAKNAPAFKDVKSSDWYAPYVAAASEAGLIQGYNGKFNPNEKINRQDIATIIGKVLENKGYSVADGKLINTYTDKSTVNSYALKGLELASQEEIINGSNGKFMPTSNANRADVAKMLYFLNQK